jgi:hypothetical protein
MWGRLREIVLNLSQHDRKRAQFLDSFLGSAFDFQVDGDTFHLKGQAAGSPKKHSKEALYTCYEYKALIEEFPSKQLTVRVFLTKETGRLALRVGDVVIPFPQVVSQSMTNEDRRKVAVAACAEAVRLELAAQKAAKEA